MESLPPELILYLLRILPLRLRPKYDFSPCLSPTARIPAEPTLNCVRDALVLTLVLVGRRVQIVCKQWKLLAWSTLQSWSLSKAAPKDYRKKLYNSLPSYLVHFIGRLQEFKITGCISTASTQIYPMFPLAKQLTVVQWEDVRLAGPMVAALLRANCPLRKLCISTRDNMEDDRLEELPSLAKTLRHLIIFNTQVLPIGTNRDPLLRLIVSAFGDTLEVLGLTLNSWEPLKAMKVLKELHIHTRVNIMEDWFYKDTIQVRLAKHRSGLPPSVGLRLCLGYELDSFRSLLIECAAADVLPVIKAGFDLDQLILHRLSRYGLLAVMLTDGLPVVREKLATVLLYCHESIDFYPKYKGRRRSFFLLAVLAAHNPTLELLFDKELHGKTMFESWLEREPKVIAGKGLVATVDVFASPSFIITVFKSSRNITQTLKFIQSHPHIFGRVDFSQLCNGKTIFNLCTQHEQIRLVVDMGAIWEQKNAAGQNAIEFASASRSDTLSPLLLALPDNDFLHYATPSIWAPLFDKTHSALLWQQCLLRLGGLAENRKESVAAMLHIALRLIRFPDVMSVMKDILDEDELPAEDQELLLDALFAKIEPRHLANCPPKLRHSNRPLPHSIVRQCAVNASRVSSFLAVLDTMKKYQPKRMDRWLRQTDAKGLTAKDELRIYLGTESPRRDPKFTAQMSRLYKQLAKLVGEVIEKSPKEDPVPYSPKSSSSCSTS